ncbi:MAG TPA: HWE histidine kinase domain-containing protein [Croceibacterium sp.]|nr:HWE histidine kinase domain-containing protein [Croceibacterium sp.]
MHAGSGGGTPRNQHESTGTEGLTRLYEALMSSTPDLVYGFGLDYTFVYANKALLAMWGRSLEESVGKRLIEVGYEPWHAELHEREIDQVVATKRPVRGEIGFPHATLGWRVYDYIFTPVFDADGNVEWVSGTTRDITDIKRAEDHLKLLVNELNHRVKNTLATIQSIAAQTFRGDGASVQARAAFEARLIALSEVHTVLTATNWEGANLREIAGRALGPFRGSSGQPQQFAADGPDVWLRPQAALAVAMAFHELASNAVKYGALSNDRGRVTIGWAVDDGRLRITWSEHGGPDVSPPSSTGFGSRLIERGLARELDGEVRLEYRPTGVVCNMDIPAPVEGEPGAAR